MGHALEVFFRLLNDEAFVVACDFDINYDDFDSHYKIGGENGIMRNWNDIFFLNNNVEVIYFIHKKKSIRENSFIHIYFLGCIIKLLLKKNKENSVVSLHGVDIKIRSIRFFYCLFPFFLSIFYSTF